MSFVLKSNWTQILAQIESGAKEGLAKSGDKMKFEMIGEMHRSKSGHIYGSHRASAPGESPASDTGRLEGSIEVTAESELVTAVAPTVGSYPLVLEFGGARTAPRPMWLPVGMRLGGNDGQVVQIIADEIKKKLS
jgi:hypothetical protein